MSKPAKTIWFPAKKRGYGWSLPCHPMGWLILIVWLVIVTLVASLYNPMVVGVWRFIALIAISCIMLFAICVVKGEKPSWRWRNK